MNVKLETLSQGTEFVFEKVKYKKGAGCWMPANRHGLRENQTLDNKYLNHACVACHPKMGGEFQEKLTIWLPEELTVSINYN